MDTSEVGFETSFTENCLFPLHSFLRWNLRLVVLFQIINKACVLCKYWSAQTHQICMAAQIPQKPYQAASPLVEHKTVWFSAWHVEIPVVLIQEIQQIHSTDLQMQVLKLLTAGSVIGWGCSRPIASWQCRSHITSLMGSGTDDAAETHNGFLQNPEKHHLCWHFQFHRFSKCEWNPAFLFLSGFKLLLQNRNIKTLASHLWFRAIDLVSVQEKKLAVSKEIYWTSSHHTFLFCCATIHISEESQVKITLKPNRSVSIKTISTGGDTSGTEYLKGGKNLCTTTAVREEWKK